MRGPARLIRKEHPLVPTVGLPETEAFMRTAIKRDFWIITFSTLALAPVLGGLGFAAVTGLIGVG